MNDSMSDDVNDRGILKLVDGSLGDVHMRRPLDEITTRGRRLRTRRRSIAGVAAVGVLGASLAVALPLHGASGQTAMAHGVTQSQAVNVDLAAWSVHTNANSTVTITVRQLRDPDKLRQVLASAGIPAVILYDAARCPSPDDTVARAAGSLTVHQVKGAAVVTIRPSAMPRGSVLSFNYIGPGTGHPVTVAIALLGHAPTPAPAPTRCP